MITPEAAHALAQQAVAEESAYQLPSELGELASLLAVQLPQGSPRILEIGVGAGGTLWLWRAMWPAAEIVAVDLQVSPCPACDRFLAHNRCPRRRVARAATRLILADSVREHGRVLRELCEPEGGPIRPFDFLHIDGDHSAAAVRSDFASYAPLVAQDGVIALHDTLSYEGVIAFWQEIRAKAPFVKEIGTPPRGYGYGLVIV